MYVGLCAAFRYNALGNTALVHLEFFPDHLRGFVPRAKNGIYRKGKYICIKGLSNRYCLVAVLGPVYMVST